MGLFEQGNIPSGTAFPELKIDISYLSLQASSLDLSHP